MTHAFPIQAIGRTARITLLAIAAFTAVLAAIVWSMRAAQPIV